jgi:hypothetical protein
MVYGETLGIEGHKNTGRRRQRRKKPMVLAKNTYRTGIPAFSNIQQEEGTARLAGGRISSSTQCSIIQVRKGSPMVQKVLRKNGSNR